MAAYQKCGVIIVSVIYAILQKIKLQNYRLYILHEETKNPNEIRHNISRLLNSTETFFENNNVTNFLFECLLINNCLAVISCIYLTSWSDKHGRKLLLILPYVGSFISDIFMLVVLYVPSSSVKTLYISECIDGLLGGTVLISMGCLCYITDSTDHRQRTFLIAIFIGLFNSLPVMDMTIQYFWTSLETGLDIRMLILCATLYRMILVVCFLTYIKMCVSESVFVLGTFQGNPWTNLLTPINVSDTVSCVFKRRLDNMRFYIIVLTTIFILYSIALFGNVIAVPQYFRSAFLWTYKEVLILSAVFTICQSLTLWFFSYLAIAWRTLDSDLGTYGCISLAFSCLALTFCKQGYISAIAIVAGSASLLPPVSVISLLSKLVERTETGCMFAGIGFLSLMTQIIGISSYTALGEICSEAEIPQVIFLLSFGLAIFALFFFVYLKKHISPHLLGHLSGSESLALINRRGQIEQLFD